MKPEESKAKQVAERNTVKSGATKERCRPLGKGRENWRKKQKEKKNRGSHEGTQRIIETTISEEQQQFRFFVPTAQGFLSFISVCYIVFRLFFSIIFFFFLRFPPLKNYRYRESSDCRVQLYIIVLVKVLEA
ncbi:unnamed protein product [Xylocopa violacea]|uniref:Transmembrane protein n=1 Tax=Xylocopa violacea TaxID=135666 RepID=A0ABP1NQU7_XYLVO